MHVEWDLGILCFQETCMIAQWSKIYFRLYGIILESWSWLRRPGVYQAQAESLFLGWGFVHLSALGIPAYDFIRNGFPFNPEDNASIYFPQALKLNTSERNFSTCHCKPISFCSDEIHANDTGKTAKNIKCPIMKEELFGIALGFFPKMCAAVIVHLGVLSVLWNRIIK